MDSNQDEGEVVEFGRPRVPRWLRAGGLLLLTGGVLALLVGRLGASPHSTKGLTVPSTEPSAVFAPTSPTTKPWPSAPGACGSEVGLAIVSSTRPTERTGIRVLLGGDRLWTVDFDKSRALTLSTLRSGEYAVALRSGPLMTYGITGTCEPHDPRILGIDANRKTTGMGALASTQAVLTSDGGAWIATYPIDAGNHRYGSVKPLGKGPAVRLPAGFFPYDAVGNILVGPLQPDQSTGPVDLLLVDSATGRIRARLGKASSLVAAGNGQVVWSSCGDPYGEGQCMLHRQSIITGAAASFPVPRSPSGGGVLSADGTLLAFPLGRATTDPRYDDPHPAPPSDVAIMHLDTGRLEIVPGVEIPAKTSPGLAFSTDGRWLAIALDAGNHVRLLAWRPGLKLPFETKPIPGHVLGSPALAPATPPAHG